MPDYLGNDQRKVKDDEPDKEKPIQGKYTLFICLKENK